jgi:excisionase family DNA binding protein
MVGDGVLSPPTTIAPPGTGDARPLRQHEVAFVLGVSRLVVRNMLRRGDLPVRWVGRLRCVDANDLATGLDLDALARLALEAVLARRIDVPRTAAAMDLPPDISELLPRP